MKNPVHQKRLIFDKSYLIQQYTNSDKRLILDKSYLFYTTVY